MVTLLREIKDRYFAATHAKGVIQNLEYAIRTKGIVLTPEEEKTLRFANILPNGAFVMGSAFGSFLGWFVVGLGDKLQGYPPHPRFARFLIATGAAFLMGNGYYHIALHDTPKMILETDGHMKMELANIILNKHSDDVYLANVVKRHFFVEHLFDDLHQDQPLFRWHPRYSYTDSAFVERTKEIEATTSDDEARSISAETNVNISQLGDLMEDPLACILGSPGGNIESNTPSEKNITVLKRSELRARRRGHRHHHRHADDKLSAF